MFSIKKAYRNFSSRGGIFMFLRAQLSSQVATWLDNLVAFGLKKTLDIFRVKVLYFFSHGIESYVFATIIGQILGGIFVCFMNYRWTFKSKDLKFKHILIRFGLVWLGSITLNTFFTFKLTELLRGKPLFINLLGNNSDDVFIVVKLAVALIVGFVWNYTMYRVFVYRDVDYRWFFRKVFHRK